MSLEPYFTIGFEYFGWIVLIVPCVFEAAQRLEAILGGSLI